MAISSDSLATFSKAGIVDGMSEEQIRFLADRGQEESHADGENLVFTENSEFDLQLVTEGKCEIRTAMNDLLYRLGPGSLIGELSFLDHKPRSAKAIAMGECRTVRFPATLLDDLESNRPDIAAKLLKNIGLVLCQKLRSTTRFAEASFV